MLSVNASIDAGGDPTGPEAVSAAARSVLEAAQALRRTTRRSPSHFESVELLASLEPALDSLGVSLAELRGPLLEHAGRSRSEFRVARAQQLDAARLHAAISKHLSEAASACGDLRSLLKGPTQSGS
jgi:hypothetical protein